MSASPLEELPKRFFGEQDRRKGELAPELCTPDYRAEIAGFPAMDAAAHGQFGQAFYRGFPDIYHTVDETLVAGNRVVTRFTLRGTHTAEFFGIPATGKPIVVSASVWLTVEAGRVSQLWAVFDQAGLLRQIGALPG